MFRHGGFGQYGVHRGLSVWASGAVRLWSFQRCCFMPRGLGFGPKARSNSTLLEVFFDTQDSNLLSTLSALGPLSNPNPPPFFPLGSRRASFKQVAEPKPDHLR